MRMTLIAAMTLLGPGAAPAQDAAAPAAAPTGDEVAGEEHFQRQCISCHVVQDEAGEVLAGRNARVGPNLHGVVGREAGSYPDYDYSGLMEAYGATGAVWDEANFVAFVQDPTGHLRDATGETSGRSKMSYQVRDEQQARDLYAFLAQFSPEPRAAAASGDPASGDAASDDADAEAASE